MTFFKNVIWIFLYFIVSQFLIRFQAVCVFFSYQLPFSRRVIPDPHLPPWKNAAFLLFLVGQTPTIEKLICSPGPYDFGNHIYREQMMRYKSAGQNPFAWMDADTEELVLNFIRTTALDFYREWVRRGKRVDPQEAAALLGAITCHGAAPLMR